MVDLSLLGITSPYRDVPSGSNELTAGTKSLPPTGDTYAAKDHLTEQYVSQILKDKPTSYVYYSSEKKGSGQGGQGSSRGTFNIFKRYGEQILKPRR